MGASGTIIHYEDSAWSPMTSGSTEQLSGVWGSGPSDVFAVGSSGTILHYDGSTWSLMSSGTSQDLYDVWGSDAADLWVTGDAGTILHYDGSTWSATTSSTMGALLGVWGNGPADVFAVGESGTIVHYDGLAWSAMIADTAQHLASVWGGPARVIAVGESGTIINRPRTCFAAELSCDDGEDEDCDGAYDCADSDCALDATCTAGGLCQGWTAITCDSSVDDTTQAGARNIDRYGCGDWLEMGREKIYRLDSDEVEAGSVTVGLTGMARDLDLYVLRETAGGGCNNRAPDCLGGSSTEGSEQVVFTAVDDVSYYLVVDGYSANAGDFTLEVSCP